MENERKQKVDITMKVVGKIHEKKMNLYIERDEGDLKIGLIDFDKNPTQFQFEEGYGMENFKIFQIQTVGKEDDQYVEGCNMGWC